MAQRRTQQTRLRTKRNAIKHLKSPGSATVSSATKRVADPEFNRLRLLKALRRAEPVSRIELMRLTGLASATVTDVTRDLLRRHVIVQQKAPAKTRGRPRIHLRLNPRAAHVVGAYMLIDGSVATEIVNLKGDLVFARRGRLAQAPSVEAIAQQLGALISDTIDASPLARSAISRVGVALPALIDSSAGVVHWLQSYVRHPSPVAAIIERKVQLPVVIDNSSNVVARAEHWFGAAQLDNFTLVTVGVGIGFARYVEGALWTGANGLNPEFSHVKAVFEDGRPCGCGARGCLSVHCGIYGMVAQIFEQRRRQPPSWQHSVEAFHALAADARNGDQQVRAVMETAGRLLGTAIANHINESDPGRVIVSASNSVLKEMIAHSFDAAVEANTLHAIRERTIVDWRVVDEDRYRKGSAALALEYLYRTPPAR